MYSGLNCPFAIQFFASYVIVLAHHLEPLKSLFSFLGQVLEPLKIDKKITSKGMADEVLVKITDIGT